MEEFIEKKCPSCEQRLRIPKNIGGMLMKCPSCGQKLYSDFKVGGKKGNPRVKRASEGGLLVEIFELPTTIVNYIKRLFFS